MRIEKRKRQYKICCNGVKDQYDAVVIDCIGSGNGGIISQLKMQNEMKLTDESWISYQQGKGNEDTIAQFFSDDESRLDLTKEQKEILEIWDGLDEKEREIFMTFIRSLKK